MDESQQLKPNVAGDPIGLKPGEIFWNNYRVINIVGRGGVSTVYKAENVQNKEIMAIKVLHAQKVTDEELVRRFVREAQNTMQLEDPHVVKIHEWGIDKLERPFMIMEFLSGETLAKRIDRTRGLIYTKAVEVMGQICSAISDAHDKGIIHRDLKPENIMLTASFGREDFVKVFDFGIAKKEPKEGDGDDVQVALTKSGAILGTPQYMSPEQLRGKKADARSDIYSLGVIMYEMLTGKPPFYSKNTAEIIVGHLNVTPESPSRMRIDMAIPEALSEAVLRALSKNPWERPTTVQQFRQSLQKAIERSAPKPASPGSEMSPLKTTGSNPALTAPAISADPIRRVCPNCKTLNTGSNFRYCLKCGQDNMNRWLPYKEKRQGKSASEIVSPYLNMRFLIVILVMLVVWQGYQFISKPTDLSGNYKATFDHKLFTSNKELSENLARKLSFDSAEIILSQEEDQLEGVISTPYGQGALKGSVTVVDPLIVGYDATCTIKRAGGRLDLELRGSFNKLLRNEIWKLSANFFGHHKSVSDTVHMELK